MPTTGAQSGVTVPVKSIATPAAKGIRASEFATPRGKIARSLRPQPPLDKLDLARPTKRSGIAPMSPPKAPTSPGKGPIRLRPLKALQRRHFKLNPANNSGYNYAYREVLRKRNERKCLPGCTRPDCCGDTIRKMLTIGGALPSNLTNLFSSSPRTPRPTVQKTTACSRNTWATITVSGGR